MDDILKFEKDDSEDFYSILGCDETASEEQIIAEYKARVIQCHPDKNLDDPTATERFSRIQKSKDILTDCDRRAKYDRWRKSGLAVSFAQWCNMGAMQTSMHWASSKAQPMIKDPNILNTEEEDTDVQNKCSPAHVGHPSFDKKLTEHNSVAFNSLNMHSIKDTSSELIQKFRNYEI